MIIQIKHGAEQGQVDNLLAWLRSHGIDPHVSVGQQITLIGCVGDAGAGGQDGLLHLVRDFMAPGDGEIAIDPDVEVGLD